MRNVIVCLRANRLLYSTTAVPLLIRKYYFTVEHDPCPVGSSEAHSLNLTARVGDLDLAVTFQVILYKHSLSWRPKSYS